MSRVVVLRSLTRRAVFTFARARRSSVAVFVAQVRRLSVFSIFETTDERGDSILRSECLGARSLCLSRGAGAWS